MAETLFSIGNLVALIGWLGLMMGLVIKPLRPLVLGIGRSLIPLILGVAYITLFVTGDNAFKDGGYGSLTEVAALMAHKNALAAGWLHYLAFDLFVGAWIFEQGLKRGVWRFVLMICLVLTFLFGPVGYLVFWLSERFVKPQAQ